MRDGFGETEAYRETKQGRGLASAKPKLTEKRSREEDWLRQNRSLRKNEGKGLRQNGSFLIMESEEWSKFFILHWLSLN